VYRWLVPAVNEGAVVVTANQRLARALSEDYAGSMLAAGSAAWPTPDIVPFRRWLKALLAAAKGPQASCLSQAQARVLWERCLSSELGEVPENLAALVRAAEQAWSMAAAFEVPLAELLDQAENRDQGVFARALRRYLDALDAEGWLDDASLTARVTELAERDELAVPASLVITGFDRVTPAAARLFASLERRGCRLSKQTQAAGAPIPTRACADLEAEWRAAGHWARESLRRDPDQRLAVVVSGLEKHRDAAARLIREGLTPGWQTAGGRAQAAVNVSLGATLDSYPAISVALLVLRWLGGALTSRQLGVLLRSSTIGIERSDARARLELSLREIASREWTLGRVIRVLGRLAKDADTEDFFERLTALDALLSEQPRRATPGRWASVFDAALKALGWPGAQPLSSDEQQLVNRWRDLLNEFAELRRVIGACTLGEAAARVRQLAAEAVFQPEDTGAAVTVLGPLEAAGLEFDALAITGLDAASWPPPGRPTPLIARAIRTGYGLPDATPEDTRAFALRVLERLSGSADTVVGSYAAIDGDSAQAVTTLPAVREDVSEGEDPGWHATALSHLCHVELLPDDPAPPVADDEAIRGGAGTIDRQLSEPFAAFASGRLGIRRVGPFAEGLTPQLRGNLLHEALFHLYSTLPTQDHVRAWLDDGLEDRLRDASRRAIARHRVAAGSTLERLFDLEEQRMRTLLERVVRLDAERSAFRVSSVEGRETGRLGGLNLSLRHDRVDESADGSLLILDYKTGTRKRFAVRGEPVDYQLVVYAATQTAVVSDLGLVNVDSRDVGIDGMGVHLSGDANFAETLEGWIETVGEAAAALARGDVRINRAQGARDARPLALLSRYQELVRSVR